MAEPADTPIVRLTGGAVIPYGLMRAYASWPLAVLEVLPGRLRIRVRLLRLLGGDSLDAGPEDVAEVFPARGRFGARGLGVRTADGRRFFFWTGETQRVLGAVADQGFRVSDEEKSESSY